MEELIRLFNCMVDAYQRYINPCYDTQNRISDYVEFATCAQLLGEMGMNLDSAGDLKMNAATRPDKENRIVTAVVEQQ